jgi:uncharacterized damage-inducible protein DinB
MTNDFTSQAQNGLPYSKIPETPVSYTAGNVMGRMIDGLGFRYYWATEGLTEADLSYKPSPDGRSLAETLDHIYRLSTAIVNASQNIANEGSSDHSQMKLAEIRVKTLENIERASVLFKSLTDNEIESCQVIFKRGENESRYPIWNLINGQIADAIWHTGQLVLMRRTTGNPINPKVNVFIGTLND